MEFRRFQQKVLILTCCVRIAVDEDEAVDHGRPPVSKADQDVGAEANREADEVGDAVVVANVLNLVNIG